MPQGSQVVNDLLLLLTLHFFLFNMCITASPPSSSSENETRRPRFLSYRVTNTRITQKMFIYILFYIDLTVQLDPEQLRGWCYKSSSVFVACCFDCKGYFLGSVRSGQKKTLRYDSYQNGRKVFIVIVNYRSMIRPSTITFV